MMIFTVPDLILYYLIRIICSGLLIAKKKLFVNPVPDGAGGGTVLFVSCFSLVFFMFLFCFFVFYCPSYSSPIFTSMYQQGTVTLFLIDCSNNDTKQSSGPFRSDPVRYGKSKLIL